MAHTHERPSGTRHLLNRAWSPKLRTCVPLLTEIEILFESFWGLPSHCAEIVLQDPGHLDLFRAGFFCKYLSPRLRWPCGQQMEQTKFSACLFFPGAGRDPVRRQRIPIEYFPDRQQFGLEPVLMNHMIVSSVMETVVQRCSTDSPFRGLYFQREACSSRYFNGTSK